MENTEKKLYSLHEVSKIYGINYYTLYRMCSSGIMPSVKIGTGKGKLYVSLQDCEKRFTPTIRNETNE